MKKIFSSGAIALALTLAFSGCSAPDSSTDTPSGQTLRVGLEGTFAPYGYHDASDQLVGFEVEIAKQIAKDLDVEPEFIETKWDSLIAGLDSDRYDIVINNINPTPERQAKYDFTDPYAISRAQILVRKDSGITKLEDLDGKKCGQTPSSDFGQTAAKAGATLLPTQGFSESAQLVINGQADCTVNDVVTASHYLKNANSDQLTSVTISDAEPVINAIMLPKNHEELKKKLNASIEKGLADGSYKSIFEKYIGEDISPQK
ncbi:hypothetical protein HMPREF9306_01537 [Propionimicrobium lymphophilum ACS-093-V-SCH5]|uniref:Solute-binding protein family 3/N-terminal domain-containing protein n=1 Tax=Propionimicrobium lymphophilum ACS-093-V-SCH5 TaxID=883161 RepID=S2WW72_9ACTN|nr:transporter substrate-binding domain-containing protein [Propionimicrobium lymphophilum]EPD31979.1 hypothetical protein HMPREF9306_01537 [Propionimicrobium lymphophilum ACS-093-V-SCH5]